MESVQPYPWRSDNRPAEIEAYIKAETVVGNKEQ